MKLQFALLISTLCPLFGQNVALPINIGYIEPAPFQVAPGQVVTLFLDDISFGADGRLRVAQAGAGDLPQSLAGVSVRITQLDGSEMQAPIFAVQQKRLCGLSGLQAGDAGCLLTMVKAQIPFELPGDPVLGDQNIYALPLPALISIDVDGRRGRGFPLQPLPDNGHVLTSCDTLWDTSTSSVCDRQVFHADGSQGEFHPAYPQGPNHSVRRWREEQQPPPYYDVARRRDRRIVCTTIAIRFTDTGGDRAKLYRLRTLEREPAVLVATGSSPPTLSSRLHRRQADLSARAPQGIVNLRSRDKITRVQACGSGRGRGPPDFEGSRPQEPVIARSH